MNSFKLETKMAFRVIGFKTTLLEGTHVYSPQFSGQKTTFFKELIAGGQMASLRPYADSGYGYAAVAEEDGQICYYAGVQSDQPLPEHAVQVHFPAGEYLILSGSGGLSRLAFDRLEDQAFGSLLTAEFEYEYSGAPIAEVLLNGDPMDAEVEVWVPVRKRNAG